MFNINASFEIYFECFEYKEQNVLSYIRMHQDRNVDKIHSFLLIKMISCIELAFLDSSCPNNILCQGEIYIFCLYDIKKLCAQIVGLSRVDLNIRKKTMNISIYSNIGKKIKTTLYKILLTI